MALTKARLLKHAFPVHGSKASNSQALPRRRLVRYRLVSGDGAHVSATFSRPERGRTAKSLTEIHLSIEDVNGEKLTVKKWWIFGADFFTVSCRFFHGLCRLFTVYKGHKR